MSKVKEIFRNTKNKKVIFLRCVQALKKDKVHRKSANFNTFARRSSEAAFGF